MVQLPNAAWLAIIAIAIAGIVGVLHVISARARDHTLAHNIRIETVSLRLQQLVRAKAMIEYRDLCRLPSDLQSQIRYLVDGIYPGDSPSADPPPDSPESAGSPIPIAEHQPDGQIPGDQDSDPEIADHPLAAAA